MPRWERVKQMGPGDCLLLNDYKNTNCIGLALMQCNAKYVCVWCVRVGGGDCSRASISVWSSNPKISIEIQKVYRKRREEGVLEGIQINKSAAGKHPNFCTALYSRKRLPVYTRDVYQRISTEKQRHPKHGIYRDKHIYRAFSFISVDLT